MRFAGNTPMPCASMLLPSAPFRRGRRYRRKPTASNRGTGIRQLPERKMSSLAWLERLLFMWVLIAGAVVGLQNTAASAQSGPPNIKTPGQVIHLSDNLDEKDRL